MKEMNLEKVQTKKEIEKIKKNHQSEIKALKESKKKIFENGKRIIEKLEKERDQIDDGSVKVFAIPKKKLKNKIEMKFRQYKRENDEIVQKLEKKIAVLKKIIEKGK